MFRILLILLCLLTTESSARWKPEYAELPQSTRDWYVNQQLNPETRARLGVAHDSCCGAGDVVKTKFQVNQKDGKDEWWWDNNGVWEIIPEDTIHLGPTPDGRPVLFVWQGKPVCFFPSEGGI